jgi:hypothetical protein
MKGQGKRHENVKACGRKTGESESGGRLKN